MKVDISEFEASLKTDIKRLRELKEENRRLKQISADLLLENRALKDVIALNPAAIRELATVLQTEHGLSERRACVAVGLQRLVYLSAVTKS